MKRKDEDTRTELPEAKEQGQVFFHDGATFVVNPYHDPGYPVLAWFRVGSPIMKDMRLVTNE